MVVLLDTGFAWLTPTETEYHIQTDEGPERYFRYQTDSGQYRKERRLADGTVIGSEGWLDNVGYFRLKDYIADKNGYRILKSKTVYIGKGHTMKEVLRIANGKQPEWVPEPRPAPYVSLTPKSRPPISYIPPNIESNIPTYPYQKLCSSPRPFSSPEVPPFHSQTPSQQLLPPLNFLSYH
ncbi:uncharacterized protein LOC113375416 [Ctenocephalides felis]|uniref:uncharacterized protein LOC113375416 n=1 Tax=Ctenocephalides felis TaxID=7515 RepID=UPI000E6E54F9|nr:uncharacterized protein LOC113375416 [Ctenocephalides felis]